MIFLFATLLTLVNLVLWASILFGLPGAWLMLAAAAGMDWWLGDTPMFGWPVLLTAAGLAALGEILEFLLSATGARNAGGTRRAAALAILGGIVGALLGTAFPAPLLGTLIGASLGAFVGSLLGDWWAGRPLVQSLPAGKGAAIGRFLGTVAKLFLGGIIVILLAVAAFL